MTQSVFEATSAHTYVLVKLFFFYFSLFFAKTVAYGYFT